MERWTAEDFLCESCRSIMFSEDINSSLRIAVYSGHEDCFHRSLTAGADVNYINSGGKTPLLVAVGAGMETGLRMLLKVGADVNRASTNGETPIMSAMRRPRQLC